MQSVFASKTAKKLDPYVPGEQPQHSRLIKLNTNENPYPPSPKVKSAIESKLDRLRLYPDPESTELRNAIAKRHHESFCKENVFVGNGSDEVLGFCFMAFFDPDSPIIFPDITYSFYPVYAQLCSIPYRLVPLNEDYSIDVSGMKQKAGGVIFANPNAPTSIALSVSEVEEIVKAHEDCLVIVDEAYVEFGDESVVLLTKKYKNLLVVKTFSKSHALAGLRIGYAIGEESLIQTLSDVKNSFNSYPLDCLAQAAALACIQDDKYCNQIIKKVCATRERCCDELVKLGFSVQKSSTNFLFVQHKTVKAEQIMSSLREEGIIVRRFKNERINNCLRITVGTDYEMDILLEELKEILCAG